MTRKSMFSNVTGMYHNCGDFLGGDFADFSTIVILSKK